MDKLEGKGVRKDGYWTSYLSKEPFASSGQGDSDSLDYLYELFAERSHQLWRPEPVLLWLKNAVRDVVEAAASGAPVAGIPVSGWSGVRRETFPKGRGNAFAHIDREALMEGQQVIPQEALQDQGPAPGALAAAAAAAGDANVAVPEGLQGNALRAFLETLLPWVNVGGGEGQEEGGAGIGLEDFLDWDSEEDG